MTFIDEYRDRFGGVEPICTVLTEHGLSFAPSTYYAAKNHPPSQRASRDAELKVLIQAVLDRCVRTRQQPCLWTHALVRS